MEDDSLIAQDTRQLIDALQDSLLERLSITQKPDAFVERKERGACEGAAERLDNGRLGPLEETVTWMNLHIPAQKV